MNPMHLSSMTRPKSILVATDLNDLDFLLPVAIDQARMTGAMIWLLHVIPPEAYASIESGAYPFVEKEKEYRTAEAALAKVALELREKNLACAYEVRRWYPVDEIKGFIREHRRRSPDCGYFQQGEIRQASDRIGCRGVDTQSGDSRLHSRSAFQTTCCRIEPRRILFALSLRHHPEHSLRFAVDLAAGVAS